jgi:hypothetical protein
VPAPLCAFIDFLKAPTAPADPVKLIQREVRSAPERERRRRAGLPKTKGKA